jgi:hypothetical protein
MRKKKNLRKRWYAKLCQRDGEHCKICNREPPDVYLEMDHVDGNRNHDPADGTNYQLLCRSHHRSKHPRGKQKRKVFVSGGTIEVENRMSPEMRKNRKAEPEFRHWLFEKVKKHGRYPVKDAINAGAERCNCSPYVIRTGYLPKLVSSEGMYMMFDDDVAGQKMLMFRNAAMLGIDAGMIELPEDEGGEDVAA